MFPALAGEITFKQDSAYGLLLVLLSLHAITLGKTPFGTFRRTWILIITGFSAAVLWDCCLFHSWVFSRYNSRAGRVSHGIRRNCIIHQSPVLRRKSKTVDKSPRHIAASHLCLRICLPDRDRVWPYDPLPLVTARYPRRPGIADLLFRIFTLHGVSIALTKVSARRKTSFKTAR